MSDEPGFDRTASHNEGRYVCTSDAVQRAEESLLAELARLTEENEQLLAEQRTLRNRRTALIALEHAEYMAQSAERFIHASNTLRALEAGEDVPELDSVERADEAYTDHYRALRNRIYEFRKRHQKMNALQASIKEGP